VSSRDTRREENQKISRRANERLHAVVEDDVREAAPIPFLCECAAEYCDGRVEVTLQEWEGIAAKPNHFVMVAGHERSEGEQVVSKRGEYEIVEKPS
jgi:hypothetical protein